MILQILSDGAISANWVMVIVVTICGFLLLRILNRIEKRQDQTDDKVEKLGNVVVRHEERHDGHDDKLKAIERASDEFKSINKNIELIMSKLRASS